MGFFDFFKVPDINQGVTEFLETSGAILLDVRTPQEHRAGHIPKSRNLPLQSLDKAGSVIDNKDTPIFVYCHSGSRSRQAADMLARMGYRSVKNIGGIASYGGKVV